MKRPEQVTCPRCGLQQSATTKRTFLCFRRFECAGCKCSADLPLPTGVRALYCVLLLVGLVALARMWATGQVAVPGLVFVGSFWGVAADLRIRAMLRDRAAEEAADHLK